jgi:hypothetical protein
MKDTDLQKVLDGLDKIGSVFGCSLVEWRHIIQDANTVWQKCPYQVGQLVQLTRAPKITREEGWGWLHASHFLIKGAAAYVATRQFYDGRFVFGLHFREESWIDFDGKVHPKTEKGLYMFGESWIQSFEETRYTEDF